jgi:hypothetical protein
MTNVNTYTHKGIYQWLNREVSIAPLVVFRVLFGVMMFGALIRFISKGWVQSLFVKPSFFFTYTGFEWVKPFSAEGMYLVFALMLLAAFMIATGLFYRVSSVAFFLLFTYVELIDKTNYLNHYYFISIIAGLLCILPANKSFSLDVMLAITQRSNTVPRWSIFSLQLQMAIVYFFAGIAKINPDWLLHAMPLKLWLPAKANIPVIGAYLSQTWLAYTFSWAGMLFDVCIAFLLFNRRTVWYAYALVVVFHIATALLFPVIGMFPYIMMVCAVVFLPETFHQRILSFAPINATNNPQPATHTRHLSSITPQSSIVYRLWSNPYRLSFIVLAIHFAIQLILPFRFALYQGPLFYTEQGYRFSWRVMLMEKTGFVAFHIKDAATGKTYEVNNRNYLTAFQERQMSTQPDMILQFAQHLNKTYASTCTQPEVYAEAYVSVNGRASQLLINPNVNLAMQHYGLTNKPWLLAQAAH